MTGARYHRDEFAEGEAAFKAEAQDWFDLLPPPIRNDLTLKSLREGERLGASPQTNLEILALALCLFGRRLDNEKGATGHRGKLDHLINAAAQWPPARGHQLSAEGLGELFERVESYVLEDRKKTGSAEASERRLEELLKPTNGAGKGKEPAARRGGDPGERVTGEVVPETSVFELKWLSSLEYNLTCGDLIKGLLPKAGVGAVNADPSGGKTAIIVDMMLHLAAGIAYRGRRTVQTPVVYIALEGHGGIENRIRAAAEEIGVNLEKTPFALLKISGNFRDQKVAEKLGRTLAQIEGSCVVVFDTYTAALGGGANDCKPEDVTAFLENIKIEVLARNHTVLLAHHFGKDQARGGRGWSGLVAALDFEWEIVRDGDLRTLRVSKLREEDDRKPALCFRFYGRVIGVDEFGDEKTAVVVEHLADEASDAPQKKLPPSPKAKKTLGKLWEMIKTPAQSFPLPEHNGLRCVLRADLEAECTKPGVVSSSKVDRDRRKVVVDALDELLKAETITIDHDRVWPVPKAKEETP